MPHVDKTLEQLENDIWSKPSFDSHVVLRTHELRKIPLGDFEVEDFRIMISQNIGLSYLIPLTIDILDNDVLAEGDFYEGDLLQAVLKVQSTYWDNNLNDYDKIKKIVDSNRQLIDDKKIDTRIFDEYSGNSQQKI